jgi:guanine deaminase
VEKDDEYYMRLAIEWSRRGMENDNMGPVGAVVVRDGQVLGEGHNRTTVDLDITAHGEMVAIRDGVRKTGRLDGLVGATIYTNCQPCPMCYSACKWAGISRIVYSLSVEDTYALGKDYGFLDVEHFADVRKDRSDIPQSQLLREEALPVLQDWAEKAALLKLK